MPYLVIMIRRITIQGLMDMQQRPLIADVRTPAEFAQGHIPGAFNLPLFTDEERIVVGTTYTQQSREAAILLGFDLAAPKWSGLIRTALERCPGKKIIVHCWRGGMRSGAVAWALDLYGFQVTVIDGGYKRFRRWALDQFEKTWPFYVIGGMTGCGKTKILHELHNRGEQTIDLEHLAQHRGSSFGTMGHLIQPSQEHFENQLAVRLNEFDRSRHIWIEDEGLTIGKRTVPRTLWNSMQYAPLFNLELSEENRVQALVQEYGSLNKEFLIEATKRIRKRLGLEHAQTAIRAIEEDRMADFIREVLVYYDKTYRTALVTRSQQDILHIPLQESTAGVNAAILLKEAEARTITK